MTDRPSLFRQLARAALLLDALQVDCLEPLDLTFVEYSVLRVLENGPTSPSRLAEAVVRSTGGMTKLVDRLERRGLAERLPDPDDRRGVLVGLTDVGHKLSAEASRTYSVGRNRILERLDLREQSAIEAGLGRLIDAFEKDRRDP